ncbi:MULTISPECIES: teichoic acids export ABC transporter ATP-binding subunit TagH [Exiguobacterium]|uniref:Teichoic acids export ABC transporter ATP-binding subunit TagH n=1 Tax=Exiguobacterium antarcticum TaxID=132920 RepID=A0ABT6QZD7_9BACL|nr:MULTISPECIES: teichoic acids export ABC transporter ATP-binding subunit TagH [Exiguobacterium]AFS69924.1 ABC transporter related protein [Exiguobacterium antarcticum B7]MCT4780995.1 teichoic acids export ABC transporter ATP-binding subunit TagH [Exiguobacterium soli]MDI3234046.1 teichoic acids export ABC transporter ATP-binding subunit TagH [Exiguobacterium antarcticum]
MSHVVFENVSKRYVLYARPIDKLKEVLFGKVSGKPFYALKNVSFSVEQGEIVGVVGINGSGKSTLSHLLANVTPPTYGRVTLGGKSALIAISSGLNNQLTGRDNIELKGLMMGLTKKQIQAITPDILEFADIGDFIDQPVKTYSSGMRARLGFAISININPDILIIDEALSVGDQTFTEKCLDKMREFRDQGKTIFFVSHSLNQVKSFCTKILWLEYGEVRMFGPTAETMAEYNKYLYWYKQLTKKQATHYVTKKRTGRSDEIERSTRGETIELSS